jgi:hypothetical protein
MLVTFITETVSGGICGGGALFGLQPGSTNNSGKSIANQPQILAFLIAVPIPVRLTVSPCQATASRRRLQEAIVTVGDSFSERTRHTISDEMQYMQLPGQS